MRAIFLASGPNFKKKQTLAPFINVFVYPLLCKLLNIECVQANGTAQIFDSVYVPTYVSFSTRHTADSRIIFALFVLTTYFI